MESYRSARDHHRRKGLRARDVITENRVALRRMIHRTFADEIRERQDAIRELLEGVQREDAGRKTKESAAKNGARGGRMVIHDDAGVTKPGELSRNRGADWLREVLKFLWRSAREGVADPSGFRLPPVLLIGPPGCGETHLARRLGELSGCDPLMIDMTAASSTGMIAGLEFSWGSAHAGDVLRHIEPRRIANPLIVLDEVEKRSIHSNGGDPIEALLLMLQRETAPKILNPWLQSAVNMSRISWVLLANSASRIPSPLLDRVRVFRVGLPGGKHLRVLVGNALGDMAEPEVIEIAAREIEAGRMSMRGLQRIRADIDRGADRALLH